MTPFIKKRLLHLLAIFSLITMQLSAQTSPAWAWARNAGGTQDDYAGGTDFNGSTVASDAYGNSYVTGIFNGTATFGSNSVASPTNPNVFVAKYDSSGNCLWVKKFGGNRTDVYGNQGKAIGVDAAGNCYVTGTFAGNVGYSFVLGSSTLTCNGARQVFVVKYDANGNALWAAQGSAGINPTNNYGTSIAADAAGNCYVTGYIGSGTVSFGNSVSVSGSGGFVCKFNTSGNAQWAVKLGPSGASSPLSITCNTKGQSFVTGFVQGSETINTSPPTSFTTTGMRDAFVCKITANGNIDWYKTYSGSGSNTAAYGKAIGVTPNGHLFLTGDFTGGFNIGSSTFTSNSVSNSNAFISYLDSTGVPVWAKQTNNTGFSGGYFSAGGVAANANGDGYFTGTYSAYNTGYIYMDAINFPNNGNQIIYVMKATAAGTLSWGLFSSGPGSGASSSGIGCDNLGNVFVAGYIQGTCSIGSNNLSNYGGMDVLVAKIKGAAPATTLTTQLNDYAFAQNASVYPNPFNSQLFIDVKSQAAALSTFMMYNALGKIVKSMPVEAGRITQLNRDELSKGIYFYKIQSGETTIASGKLVVD